MSSEKNKSVGTVIRRKTRAGAFADAPSLKQKTLFDSFFSKNAPPKDAAQPSAAEGPRLTVDASASDVTSLVEPLPQSTPTMAIDEPATSASELIQNTSEPTTIHDTPEPQPVLEPVSHSPKSILIDDDSPTSSPTPRAVRIPASERKRSPSVIIIEDAMFEPPTHVKAVRVGNNLTFKQEGKSADAPIVIESSPIRPLPSSSRPSKPVHPFFGANSKASTQSSSLLKKVAITQHTARLPTFPGRNAQHIRGTQTHISRYQPVFPTRDISHSSKQAFEHSDYSFLKEDASSRTPDKPAYLLSNTIYDSNLNDIPQEHRDNHPAIARVLEYSRDEPLQSRRPWTDKWRPTCAQEVLGNEQSAVYLRNWLQALELQFEDNANPVSNESQASGEDASKNKAAKRNLKRARVVRAVDKKRKKTRFDSDEEDDSWIVPTDEESEEENVTYESLGDFDDFLAAPPPISSSPSACPDSSIPVSQASKATKEPDLGQLHNTILLVGPHGVGKTASIYACADELGWEVFEVYPGIGRRNGANVDNLVGEVGKNHLVLQNRHNADSLKSFFQKQKQAPHPLIEDTWSGYSPRKRSASGLKFSREAEEPMSTRSFRQSLILLEEVDILYKEDSNFWSTVVRIIKECKRPVICTCNDISLIPLEELPLQNILYFNRPAPEIAVSYLSGLCAAEGRPVQRELVSGLYTAPQSPEQVPNWDLRRDINNLQVLTSTANSLKDIEQSGPNNIGADRPFAGKVLSNRRAETLSFLDGVLHLDSTYHSTVTEMASYEPSENDEIGHTILYDLHAPATSQTGLYDRHEYILAGARRHFRDVFDASASEDGLATEAIDEMAAEMGQGHRRVLGEVCPMAVWARQDAGVALDYIPLVRQMVAADDEGERREAGQRRGRGRVTRNSSGRSGYIRMIGMTEEGRRVLYASGFDV